MQKKIAVEIICSTDCNRMRGSSRCIKKITMGECRGERIYIGKKSKPKKYMIVAEGEVVVLVA